MLEFSGFGIRDSGFGRGLLVNIASLEAVDNRHSREDVRRMKDRLAAKCTNASFVQDTLIAAEMNPFDAALALIALGHLGADPRAFAPALNVIVASLGEGGRRGPFRAYEWNKMKTPTRILVGGPEVTSAFVLMGLAVAKRAMAGRG